MRVLDVVGEGLTDAGDAGVGFERGHECSEALGCSG